MENKKSIIGVILGLIVIGILYNSYNNKISDYEKQILDYESEISSYKSEISNYESEIEELNVKVEEAKPWFNMDKNEQQKIIDEQQAKKAKEKEEQEKQAKLQEENKNNDNYEFDYHYDGEPTSIGNGITMSKCPYCGGRYVDDINDGSSYCMDCGVGIDE